MTVRVGGQDHASGRPQRLGVDVLRITDDVVRLALQVEERVSTGVDADEQRLVLADEVLQILQRLAVSLTRADHNDLAATQWLRLVRNAQAIDVQRGLGLGELHQVAGESLQAVDHAGAALVEGAL